MSIYRQVSILDDKGYFLYKKVVLSILICVRFLVSLKAEAALLGWDLVDSGKHLDWDSNSKYISIINRSVGIWEGYRQGIVIVRRDSWNKWQDVFISDYNEVSNTLGVTSSRENNEVK